jgi:hypothetical protein
MASLSERVWQYLRDNACGKGNAKLYRIMAQELLPDLHPKQSWRRVAKAVETLRKEGKPVCTSRKKDQAGAFIPETKEEGVASLAAPYAALFHQKRALDRVAEAIELMFEYQPVKEVQEEFEDMEVKQAV